MVSGGFAGYGLVGGGLAIHDRQTGETELLNHEEVIEHESTITMRFLRDGRLIGGTSIAAPGGGHPPAEEGTLYILDVERREVVYTTNPVAGAREVFSIEVGPEGLVYGFASGAQFFVFDPESREVVHQADLAEYGNLPRQTLVRGPDGSVYGAFTRSIVRITPGSFEHESSLTRQRASPREQSFAMAGSTPRAAHTCGATNSASEAAQSPCSASRAIASVGTIIGSSVRQIRSRRGFSSVPPPSRA